MIQPEPTQSHKNLPHLLHSLLHDQSGNAALEYAMMLALLVLGTTTMLSGAANFFLGLLQGRVSAAAAAWPT
jgi:Flp pilus assembly pilin Flp